jgi:hypothetical protein
MGFKSSGNYSVKKEKAAETVQESVVEQEPQEDEPTVEDITPDQISNADDVFAEMVD